MTNLPPPPKEIKRIEKLTDEEQEEKEKKDAEKPRIDGHGRVLTKVEERKDDGKLRDARGQVINPGAEKEVKQAVHMKAGTKKLGDDGIDNAKHISFENYLVEMKKACSDKHLPSQRCQNCTAVQVFSYKVKYDCLDHKPFPLGMCNKCLPPAVVLMRQSFRHVDYCSFQNAKEISQFVGAWQQTGLYEQRTAWLYGYYSSDPNFPDGVRVNVEAIYEPPQIGEKDGYQALEDPGRVNADLVAGALGLERVGHMFTTLNKEKVPLTSSEYRRAAAYQQEHLVDHPDGYKVSKFLSVRVEQKETEEIEIECYMVSDQCQALERDNVLGDSPDPKKAVIRVPKREEAMPAVLQEGAPVKEFEPSFFLVNLSSGMPNENNTQHNILKRCDYPVKNRFEKQQTQQDLKLFLQSSKGMKTNERFACFQSLLHIADMLGVETAITMAQCVAMETAPDAALVELVESLC